MKKYWVRISTKIDSMTLRERCIVFIGAAGLLIFLVFYFYLNPLYARQKAALTTMAQQRDMLAGVDADIAQTLLAHTLDPDAAERARLARIQAEVQQLQAALTAMQQGMVPPERMTAMLEQMLRAHRGLRLTSLRTLPDDSAPPAPATAPGAAAAAPQQLLHRHGVELVLAGSYPDMVAYMAALENMQGQLFWGSARLKVDSYPNATLTLVVYTVSLDKKWLKL
jgi:MSHA biogenesis protein MshJ